MDTVPSKPYLNDLSPETKATLAESLDYPDWESIPRVVRNMLSAPGTNLDPILDNAES